MQRILASRFRQDKFSGDKDFTIGQNGALTQQTLAFFPFEVFRTGRLGPTVSHGTRPCASNTGRANTSAAAIGKRDSLA